MPRHPLAESRLKTCIALSRLTSVILVLLLIPLCAKTLNSPTLHFSLFIGAALSLGYSTSWNLGCMIHYFSTKKHAPFRLSLFMDVITAAAVVVVFSVLLEMDGSPDGLSSVALGHITTPAFAILIIVAGLHFVSFTLTGALFCLRPDDNFGPQDSSATLSRAPRASIVNNLAGRGENLANLPLGTVTRPEPAATHSNSSVSQRNSISGSWADALPLYTNQDTALPPVYESKPTSEC